jgi:hypothetical protein
MSCVVSSTVAPGCHAAHAPAPAPRAWNAIQACGGFIQKQQTWVGQQCTGNGNLCCIPARHFLHGVVDHAFFQAQPGEQFYHLTAGIASIQTIQAGAVQQFSIGESFFEERSFNRYAVDQAAGRGRVFTTSYPNTLIRTANRATTGWTSNGSGWTCHLRWGQALQDFTLLHLEGQMIYCHNVPDAISIGFSIFMALPFSLATNMSVSVAIVLSGIHFHMRFQNGSPGLPNRL